MPILKLHKTNRHPRVRSDTIRFDPDTILQDMQSDEQDFFNDKLGKYRWEFDEEQEKKYENMDSTYLDVLRNIFVRAKGFHEGMFRGFYKNSTLQHTYDEQECLGNQSYEDLDVVAGAIEKAWDGDFQRIITASTAAVRFSLDNWRHCKFQ